MIDFVQGILVEIEEDSIIVNVNGIGYQIFVSRPDLYNGLKEDNCFVYTHHHMREDWMGLYGFQDKEERYLFRLLLGVSGIGPKGALAMIAQGNPNKVIEAIATEDEKALTKMPGVGKKTAQRIILDLKDKVKGLSINANIKDDTSIKEADIEAMGNGAVDLKDALKALGYHEQEIQKAIKALENEIETGQSIDQLIKKALLILMKD